MPKNVLIFLLFFSMYAKSEEVINIYTEVFPPYQIETADGGISGINTMRVQQLFNQAGIAFDVQVFPWARAYKLVQEQHNSFIFSMLKTSAREPLFHWVIPLCRNESAIYKNQQRDDIQIKTLNDIKNWRVGVSRGQAAESFMRSLGFAENQNLVVVNQNDQLREMLLLGRIDLIIVSDIYLANLRDKNVAKIDSLQRLFAVEELSGALYLATNINTDLQLIEKLKQADSALRKDSLIKGCSQLKP